MKKEINSGNNFQKKQNNRHKIILDENLEQIFYNKKKNKNEPKIERLDFLSSSFHNSFQSNSNNVEINRLTGNNSKNLHNLNDPKSSNNKQNEKTHNERLQQSECKLEKIENSKERYSKNLIDTLPKNNSPNSNATNNIENYHSKYYLKKTPHSEFLSPNINKLEEPRVENRYNKAKCKLDKYTITNHQLKSNFQKQTISYDKCCNISLSLFK